MSKILANQIANYGDDAPIEIKEGLNIPAGKPIQAAGVTGTSGQVLSSTGTTIQWVDTFDGDYNSLSNKPSIPAAQVNSDWDATSGIAVILNKPVVPAQPSVTTTAAGSPALSYNSTNGEFTYTPPNLSSYLTSLGDAAGVTTAKITNWDTAYGWGDHGSAGYLTSYTETDPVFAASDAANVNNTKIGNWDTAFGWGDHSTQGYLTSAFLGSSSLEDLGDVSLPSPNAGQFLKWDGTNWIAAGGVGGGVGIALSDLSVTTASAGTAALSYSNISGIFTYTPPDLSGFAANTNVSNWDTAYGWGNHASAGYITNGLENIVEDTSPQLGGNLDLNSNGIQGTGHIDTNSGIRGVSLVAGKAIDTGLGEGWFISNTGQATARRDEVASVAQNVLTIGNANELSALTIDGSGNLSTVAAISVAANSGTTGTGSKISIGATGQLELFHTSNNSSGVRSTGGVFAIQNQMNTGSDTWDKAIQLQAYGEIQLRFMGGNDAVVAKPGAEVVVCHAGSAKLETHTDGIKVTGGIVDKDGNLGTAGQVLSSTGTELEWVNQTGGGGGANVTISDTIPAGTPSAGDLWWESDTGRLKVYYTDVDSSQWVDTSPPLADPNALSQTTTNGTNGINITSDTNANAIEFQTDNGTTSAIRWRFTSNGHLLPNDHEQYDIGSAEKKVRHLFLSDNTLYFEGDFLKVAQHNEVGTAQAPSYLIPLSKLKDALNASGDYEAFKTAILAITDA